MDRISTLMLSVSALGYDAACKTPKRNE